MKAKYIDKGVYEVELSFQTVLLTTKDILDINQHDFVLSTENGIIHTRDKLMLGNEILKDEIKSLQGLLSDANETNLKLENMLL